MTRNIIADLRRLVIQRKYSILKSADEVCIKRSCLILQPEARFDCAEPLLALHTMSTIAMQHDRIQISNNISQKRCGQASAQSR